VTSGEGSSSETVIPDLHATPKGETLTKRFRVSGIRYSVKISNYASAWMWDGKPKTQTGWGYGH
jgi:hypothetical protein